MNPPSAPHSNRREVEIGLLYGISAYAWWGLIPIYFKLVRHLPPLTVLSHRVVWSFVFLALLVVARARWDELRELLGQRRTLLMLAASTVLLASNWGFFIYAVAKNVVLQSSLGYFMVPLVSAALGVGVLKERLRPWQMIGLGFAAAGVAVLTVARGTLPWLALVLAFSWGGYSLIRKVARVGPLIGATVETAMLIPVALLYIGLHQSEADPLHSWREYLLLVLGGVVTALPLLWFAAAARRLRLTTLGFLQYIAPTGQFLLAVVLYQEPFGATSAVGFSLIWMALAIYTVDSFRAYRAAATRPASAEAVVGGVAEI